YQFFWPDDKSIPAGKYTASVDLAYGDGASPATYSGDVQVQIPGQRIETISPSASGQPAFTRVVANQPVSQGSSPVQSPLQGLLPAIAGGVAVLVGLGAFQLGRRRTKGKDAGRDSNSPS